MSEESRLSHLFVVCATILIGLALVTHTVERVVERPRARPQVQQNELVEQVELPDCTCSLQDLGVKHP